MTTNHLRPIGYVDNHDKYYPATDVHQAPDMRLDTPRWLFDWALKQVNDHYDRSQ